MENNKDFLVKNQKQIEEIKQEIIQIPKGKVEKSYFSGPSIYFHQEALKCCRNEKEFLGKRHIEMIYATLVAWGMHRMGKSGAKMPDFDVFKKSILDKKQKLQQLKTIRIEKVQEKALDDIIGRLKELIFKEDGINASETNSRIVSGTKVLAHILPDIVPPMDRNYTAAYFGINIQNSSQNLFDNGMHTIWNVYQDKNVRDRALEYHKEHVYISLPKLFDNVIIKLEQSKKKTTNNKTTKSKK